MDSVSLRRPITKTMLPNKSSAIRDFRMPANYKRNARGWGILPERYPGTRIPLGSHFRLV
jgi:hypothetical protein